MKNPFEVLRTKEQELARVQREIEALRIALPLLGAEELASFSPVQVAAGAPRRVAQLP
jgi:hypothetical protein